MIFIMQYRTKKQCYKDFFGLVLKKPVPDYLLDNYLDENDEGDGYLELADFVFDNMRKELEWSTALAIIESADLIFKTAVENDNFKEVPF